MRGSLRYRFFQPRTIASFKFGKLEKADSSCSSMFSSMFLNGGPLLIRDFKVFTLCLAPLPTGIAPTSRFTATIVAYDILVGKDVLWPSI